MRTFILLAGFALLSLTSVAQTKVGTIDADYILSQMPGMTGVQEGMKAYDAELQGELKGNITTYENLVKDYQEKLEEFTEEEKQQKETEIVALENDIKGFRQKASVMLQMRRNELTQPLYEKINAAMLQVIQEEGYTQVLHAGGNALAFAAEEHDITQKVLEKLGIEIKE